MGLGMVTLRFLIYVLVLLYVLFWFLVDCIAKSFSEALIFAGMCFVNHCDQKYVDSCFIVRIRLGTLISSLWQYNLSWWVDGLFTPLGGIHSSGWITKHTLLVSCSDYPRDKPFVLKMVSYSKNKLKSEYLWACGIFFLFHII